MTHSFRLSARLILALVVVLPLSGCGDGSKKSKIWVYHYPDFYVSQLKRVAVLPFGNRTRAHGVGESISDKVSAVLTNNGTYEVYTRQHLQDVLKEHDAAASGLIEPDLAMRIGKRKSVQALVCGACSRYETATRNETRYNNVPVYGINAKGKKVITGWRKVPYVWTRHDAFAECQVHVIDAVTGRQIAAVYDPSNIWAGGSPPKYQPADLLRMAQDDQVARIVKAIAVTRTRVKLKGTVLKTATGLYDQKWDWQKHLTPEDKQFSVVVRLPSEADRNNFKITIVPKGERVVVAEEKFVWDKKYARRGYAFKIKPIIDQHGFGEYQAKLYSGPEPIARYNFEIVEER
ncbi:MAG: hypothetical protein KAV82_04705 [Phycisphaerae bacterium]|nr:hypothetical protein [Phycisphaerae bacterium]